MGAEPWPEWLSGLLTGLGSATVLGLLLKAGLGVLADRRQGQKIRLDQAKMDIQAGELSLKVETHDTDESKMLLEQQRAWGHEMAQQIPLLWERINELTATNVRISTDHAECVRVQGVQAGELATQAQMIERQGAQLHELRARIQSLGG